LVGIIVYQSNSIMDQMNFSGRSVIVTGGTTGIGRAIAYKLAAAGAKVVLAGQDPEHLAQALNSADADYADRLKGVLADLSTEDGIIQLFDEADKELDKLDLFINNAALAAGGVTEGNYNEWNKVVQTNLTAYIACAGFAAERMKRTGTGHIINIGSMSADTREKGSTVYVATKAGIQGFSESLRKEVNELGIKVSLIEPGAVDTDMQPAGTDEKAESVQKMEMLQADDIAAAVMYIASQPTRCDVVELKIRPHLQII
jgi:NADP-dependent 3-hydroxy acid dehydrogenase YdfG